MTRHTARDAPPHVHLSDAAHHLANARRSLQAAGHRAPVELRLAVLATERRVRRLGKAAARSVRFSGHIETAAGAAASMHEMRSSEANSR